MKHALEQRAVRFYVLILLLLFLFSEGSDFGCATVKEF